MCSFESFYYIMQWGIMVDMKHKNVKDDEFWDEADSRLGFAIRDLPSGTGKEKWLDPTCKLFFSRIMQILR